MMDGDWVADYYSQRVRELVLLVGQLRLQLQGRDQKIEAQEKEIDSLNERMLALKLSTPMGDE